MNKCLSKKTICYFILIILGLSISKLSYADMDDFEVAEILLNQGKGKLAYSLAVSYVTELDTYESFRIFIKKFPDAPKWPEIVQESFEKAKEINTKKVYDDFISIAEKTPQSFMAVTEEYKLFQEVDTISEYERFIKKFPNTPEAVTAMERIHQIAFKRAQQADESVVYDQYVRNFPYAKQITIVINLAKTAESRELQLEKEGWNSIISFFSNGQEERETTARRIFNEARQAEKNNELFITERKYEILRSMFHDTKAFTEFLNREENLAYQKEMKAYQEHIIKEIQNVKSAVNQQTIEVTRAFDKMRREIQAVKASVQNAGAEVGRLRMSVNNLSGDIARAMNMQMDAIDQARENAAREAERIRAANEALYQKAEEESRYQAYKSRNCAEILAKKGKYGWLDDCP
ncbi:putative Chromosome partition protein Smc [Candidatus Magnetomoraceae bacterium gMMP-13]